jgi:hypothetical protein
MCGEMKLFDFGLSVCVEKVPLHNSTYALSGELYFILAADSVIHHVHGF